MSETALYRKYRPQKFDDVLGQDHIIKVLKSSIELGNISHAYLFSGSRGTGKTSVARILAHEIGTSGNDLYEIDAASNRGIDDIRALKESVNTHPFDSKYKVYIVDEVHMLTKEAFNALLKTLEEPPPHVVFILATTEIDKLPDTVVSRCQSFHFKKPNHTILKTIVAKVAKSEGFTLEPSAADLIAMLGDGSFRDAQGILQKVISSSPDKKISVSEVETVTGAPRAGLVHDIISAISEKDIDKALKTVAAAAKQNIEMKTFLKLILTKIRYLLLLRVSPTIEQTISEELSEDDIKFLKDVTKKNPQAITSATLLDLLNAYEQTGRSYVPELPLELALVKIVGQ